MKQSGIKVCQLSFLDFVSLHQSYIFILLSIKKKDKTLILFSSPQPSPAGEGARDDLNLIGYKIM